MDSGRAILFERGVGIDCGVVNTVVTVVSRPYTPAAGSDQLKDCAGLTEERLTAQALRERFRIPAFLRRGFLLP